MYEKTNLHEFYINAGDDDFALENDEYNHVYDDNEDGANNGANEYEEYGAVPDEDDTSTYPSTSGAASNEEANMDDYY